MNVKIGDLIINLKANVSSVENDLKKTNNSIENLAKTSKKSLSNISNDTKSLSSGFSSLKNTFSQFTGLLATAGITAGVQQFLSYTMQISNEIGNIVDKSKLLGETFANTKYLGNIAETSGVGEDKITEIYKKMLLNYKEGKLDEPFKKLNIEMSKFDSANMLERLMMVSSALSKIDDTSEQLTLSKQIGGKSASALPMLSDDKIMKWNSNRIENPDAFETFGDNVYKFKEVIKTDFAIAINDWVEGVNILYNMWENDKMKSEKDTMQNRIAKGESFGRVYHDIRQKEKENKIKSLTPPKENKKSTFELELENDLIFDDDKLETTANKYLEDIKTPYETFLERETELNEMKKRGLITDEQRLKILEKINDEYNKLIENINKKYVDEQNQELEKKRKDNPMYGVAELASNFINGGDENKNISYTLQEFIPNVDEIKKQIEINIENNKMADEFQKEQTKEFNDREIKRNSGLGGAGSMVDMLIGQVDYGKVLQQRQVELTQRIAETLQKIAENTKNTNNNGAFIQ